MRALNQMTLCHSLKKFTIIANFGFRLQKAHSQPVIFTSPRGDPIVYFPDYPLKKEVKPKSRYVPGPAAMVDAFPHLLPKPHQHHQGRNSVDILYFIGNLECKLGMHSETTSALGSYEHTG